MDDLIKYWPVMTTVVGGLLVIGGLHAKYEARFQQLDSRVTKVEEEQSSIGPSIAEIKTDIKWIKQLLSSRQSTP